VELKTNGIGGERTARQPRPVDRVLAFLDPLLGRAALIVEATIRSAGRDKLYKPRKLAAVAVANKLERDDSISAHIRRG
jgi:hypothetical protein